MTRAAGPDERRRVTNYHQLPDDLPMPIDDGATEHLVGAAVPAVGLESTSSRVIDIAQLPGRTALFI